MAEAAVTFTVQKLGDLLIEKVGFLRGVEEQVKWLKRELERMRCFLKDAAEKQCNDERIRKWISEIGDLAQDAEDVIETFILKLETPTRSRGLLEKCACFPNHVYHLDKLGLEIESIRARLQEIDNSRERYGIRSLDDGVVSTSSRRRSEAAERRRLSPLQRDKHLVGLEEDVESLLHKAILEEREGLSIATIIGMGGIGKSTLARVLYNHPAISGEFEHRAWVIVSEEFNLREVIRELVLQLLKPDEDKLKVLEIMEKTTDEDLIRMLRERLEGRRYFIVLDDLWRQQDWKSLEAAFPDDKGKTTSRLLVTSRIDNVLMDARYVHKMKTLDNKESWQLFLNKAFTGNTNCNCPPELEDIGREIVKKCSGLPLAIDVVGGLLREQRQSRSGWERILRGMESHLRKSEDTVTTILELSYHDLFAQLKSCFLCLGFFKEDATIRAEKLVQMWIAEGLISQGGDNQETMEEIATSYLDELINRNMVQVQDVSLDGRVKTCQIHDLLRDLSIKKAKEEISFEILKEGISPHSLDKESRHCSIYCSTKSFISSTVSRNKHLRSLLFHGNCNIDDGLSYNWKSFGLLRMLDFEGFGLRKLSDSVGTLIGLRYLGLRDNRLLELPSTLGRLKKLEVLDVARNSFLNIPYIIWKMENLRHLYVSYLGSKVHQKIHALKNLQTLTYISFDNWMVELPTQMTSLRKLGIHLGEQSDVNKLCDSLALLKNLVCLNLKWRIIGALPSLDKLVCLQSLTQLKLDGPLTSLPSASSFPPNLSYLTLVRTILPEDPMPILENLSKLSYLKLDTLAYVGEEMAISNVAFDELKVLSLRWQPKLRNIKIEKGGMVELKRLEIYNCRHLNSLPKELRFMTNLQELKMVTTQEIASKLRGEDFSNITYVDFTGLPPQNLGQAGEAAISFAVEKLGEAMIRNANFLGRFEGELNGLRDELEKMYGFLQDAAQKKANDNRIREWISDVRQVAQHVEDAIETFILEVNIPRSTRQLERCACGNKLDELGKEIEFIQERLQDLDRSRESYGIQNVGEGIVLAERSSADERRRLRLSASQRNKHVVGLKKQVEGLLHEAILNKKEGRSVVGIEGENGIGKSTLARLVYSHPAVIGQFDHRAWVVHSEFGARKLIKELVVQLLDPNVLEEVEELPLEHLKQMLHERLKGAQYFIVLDNVSHEGIWESIEAAFPDEQDKASRLVMTSREEIRLWKYEDVLSVRHLDPIESWQLLLNNAFINNTNAKCPPELEDIGRQIVRNCEGLPLAITVIGGLLQKKGESRSGWEEVLKGMNFSNRRWDKRETSMGCLRMSYYDLPPHLKSCFLCLAFFRRDAAIRAKKLVQVWIAEGLVPQQRGDDQETMEEIARGYLDELIIRNMVQVISLTKDDRVKNCQIHDSIWQLSYKMAEKEINFDIAVVPASLRFDRSRHQVISFTKRRFFSWSFPPRSYLRSLFFQGADSADGIPSNHWKSLRLLRILDFEGSSLKSLPKTIGVLMGLRYLGLRNNKISELPSSLGRLKNLEVLDIVGNKRVKVPNVLWKMDSLRHLYMSTITWDEPLRFDTLKNLETLFYVPVMADNWLPKQLIQMTNLRELGIRIDSDTDVTELVTSLVALENLACLKLWWSGIRARPLDGLSTLFRLTQLKLKGRLSELPGGSDFPPNLSHLTLQMSELREDPMPVFEKLPELLFLKLSRNAYVGEKMSISHDGFPTLRALCICWLCNVTSIELVGTGGVPKLERFEVDECPKLKSLPDKLRSMASNWYV